MSIALSKFQPFVANLDNGIFNFASDTLKVALTNSAPTATNNKLSDITEISYSNCSSRTITVTSSTQSSGTYSLILQALTLTATGTVGPFRYVVIYDDTPTNKNLVCYFDYGVAVTMASGNTFTITFDAVNGLFQLT